MRIDQNFTEDLIARAKRKGASAVDVVAVEGDSASVQVRLSAVDKLSKAQEKRLGLRVYFGRRSAGGSTSDFSPPAVDELVATTCALAEAIVEDPDSGLPEPTSLALCGLACGGAALWRRRRSDRRRAAGAPAGHAAG